MIIWRVLFWVKNFCSKEKEISNLNMPNHWIERAKETKEESSFKVKLILVQITSSNLRRRFIEHTRLLLNFLNNWKMLKLKSKILRKELSICNQKLPFISQSGKIPLIRNWLNTSTTSLKDKSWRSFSWEKVKAFINSEPREFLWELTWTESTSELVVDIFPLTNSSTSILQLNSKNLKEKTQLEDSMKRSPFKRHLWIELSVNRLQSISLPQEVAHHKCTLLLQSPSMDQWTPLKTSLKWAFELFSAKIKFFSKIQV